MQGRPRNAAVPSGLVQVAAGRVGLLALQPRVVRVRPWRVPVPTVPKGLRLKPRMHRLRCVPAF